MSKVKKFIQNSKNYFFAHENISACLFFVLLICIFFAPVIFFGKTLTTSVFSGGVMSSGAYKYNGAHPLMFPVRDPGAFNWQDEPLTNYIGKVIKNENHIPLWNPNMGLGYPILGGIQEGIFFPLNWINFLFSSELSWDIFFLIRIFLAGFFTYFFARKIGLERKSAFLAGTVFMFSGYTIAFLNMAHFSSEAFIPFVLLSFELFLQTRNVKNFLLSVLAIALVILPGMPEATIFALILGGLWFVFSLFFIHKEISQKMKIIFAFIFANILSFVLSSVQLLPFIEFLKMSFNSHSDSFIGLSSIPLGMIASIFYPTFNYFFNPFYYDWIFCFFYIGIVAFVLFFLTIFSVKNFEKKEAKIIIFFGFFTFLMLAKIFGFIFINWIGSLPVLNSVIFWKYAIPEIMFSVAIVSAFGYSLLIRKKIPFLNLKMIFIFILMIFLTAFSLYEYMSSIVKKISETDSSLKNLFQHFISYFRFDLTTKFIDTISSSMTLPFLALVIISGLFIFLFFWVIALNVNRKTFPAITILIFVIVELYIYTLPLERADRYDTFKKAPYVGRLQQDKSVFRTYGQTLNGQYSLLFPNISSVFGIQDIRILMALVDKRYFMFLKNVLDVDDSEINNVRFTGNSQIPLDNKFFDLLNVKYFLLPPEMSSYTLVNQITNEAKFISGNVEYFKSGSAKLGGKKLQGFMLHAPSKIEFPFQVESKDMVFEYGIAESGINESDGVQFSVFAKDADGKETQLLKDFINPQDQKYHKWQEANLDLSAYVGKKISLVFQSDPGKNNAYDHFFFGNFKDPKNDVVYDKEITILENKNAFPRAFVVHRAENISDSNEIFTRLKATDFDIRNRIIIEKNLPENMISGNNSPENDNSVAKITNYNDQEVQIDAKMENDGFLVLTDQYYPGWKAFVDEKETEIYPTDYIFRSIYLKKGSHVIRFVYDPLSYRIGKYISLIILLVLIGLFTKRRRIDKYLNT